MKITACCPSFKRPILLGRALHCFEQQTHPDKYMIVLEDSGCVPKTEHPDWTVISRSVRFPNLGAKRKHIISLAPYGTEAILTVDDDDVYLPWAMECVDQALQTAPWALCRTVYEINDNNKLFAVDAWDPTGFVPWWYLGCTAFTLEAYNAVGGYVSQTGTEDLILARKLHAMFGPPVDASADRPWYVYCRNTGSPHVSDEGNEEFYEKRASYQCDPVDKISVGWNGPDVSSFPILPG